jgi:tetratricopeptide (TPR) repeat protein
VERANLVAAVQHAADAGHHKHAWELADNLRGYFWLHMHITEWMAAARAGVAAAEAAGDLRGQAAGELSLASLSWRTGQYPDVVRHGAAALGLARRADWIRGQAAVLGNVGLASARLGDVELGASQLRKAQILSRQAGWHYGEASALGNLGMMLAHAGQLAEAAEAARRALAMTEELGSRNGQAINLLVLGIVDWVAGLFRAARDKFDRAHAFYTHVQSSSGLCTARYWLALLHGVCGRYEQASALAESTVVLARTKGHREFVVHGFNVLADVQLRRAEYATAIETYSTAIDLARQLDERCGALAEAHIGMAAACLPVNDLERALSRAQRGLVVAECAGLRLMEAQASTVLAQVHLARDDVALALDVGTRALELHDMIGHRLGQSRTHQLLGNAWWRQGDVDCAIRHWRNAHDRLGSEATGSPASPVPYELARAEAASNTNQGSRPGLDGPPVRFRPHEQGSCSSTSG